VEGGIKTLEASEGVKGRWFQPISWHLPSFDLGLGRWEEGGKKRGKARGFKISLRVRDTRRIYLSGRGYLLQKYCTINAEEKGRGSLTPSCRRGRRHLGPQSGNVLQKGEKTAKQQRVHSCQLAAWVQSKRADETQEERGGGGETPR